MYIQNSGIMHIPNSRHIENPFKYPRWSAFRKQLTAIIIFADLAKYSRNISFSRSLLYAINIMNFFEYMSNFRGSRWRWSKKKAVLKAFAIFTGKYLCWSTLNTCACNFIKKRIQTGVFLSVLRNFSENLCWRTSANGCLYNF